ncbi:MAG: N-acetyl-alpha-D-glucosaminyl L-malate synthase BshA [Flavobacteriales bacterium]|nr:N-acetyl-alpha-D-glucosaminyl L-malate synthase BshA [Flavobacteriales bacterium]MCB9448808.1 N-acetyl-alpha-D-glucosaminyl L-malate synthase BshA [Flavobacteriales bacterium]
MKIGIVCYPTFGGSGVVATELGKALAARNHEVHFISYSQPVKLDIFNRNLHYHEVRIQDYPLFDYTPYELALTSKLVDVTKYAGLDLLHVHYAIPHASAAYMAKQILASYGIRSPYVTTLHGTDITLVGRDQSYEPVITFAINQSDRVTAVSEYLRKATCDYFDINREIDVIPNFICPDEYAGPPSADLRRQFAPNGEKLLIHTSNFRPVKRVEDVVEVFARVRKVRSDVRLLLVGDGPNKVGVEKLCRDLNICEHVEMLGKLKDVEPLLQISDMFLLTSEYESFGLAALEAMAAGVPVVSSNTGGIPEVNEEGVSGFLCNVGDVDAMAARVLEAFGDESLLKKLQAGARKRAEMFDIRTVLPLYENLYREVVSAKVEAH